MNIVYEIKLKSKKYKDFLILCNELKKKRYLFNFLENNIKLLK